jgi:hypothetical protein
MKVRRRLCGGTSSPALNVLRPPTMIEDTRPATPEEMCTTSPPCARNVWLSAKQVRKSCSYQRAMRLPGKDATAGRCRDGTERLPIERLNS